MKKVWIIFILILSLQGKMLFGQEDASPFQRPLSCPLRLTQFNELRDQMQTLANSLGTNCTQNGQKELNQALTNMVGLETVASSWQVFNTNNQQAIQAQFARNLNLILRNLSIITANNTCFNDIRSRGGLPVLGDVVSGLSQFGLLFPTAPGMIATSGGLVIGSTLKIIHQLVKKKYNWNRPEERRLFLQLNCAFFDNRKVMDELGLFNPETKEFRNKIEKKLRQEMVQLLKTKKGQVETMVQTQKTLDDLYDNSPPLFRKNLKTSLLRTLEDLFNVLNQKPSDELGKNNLLFEVQRFLDAPFEENLLLLDLGINENKKIKSFIQIFKELKAEIARSEGINFKISLNDFEIKYRAPLVASLFFVKSFKDVMEKEMAFIYEEEPELGTKIRSLKTQLAQEKILLMVTTQHISIVEKRIKSIEGDYLSQMFSSEDEGKTSILEILENYRKLQGEILGKLGGGYLSAGLKKSDELLFALEDHFKTISKAKMLKSSDTLNLYRREFCAGAKRARFIWSQYSTQVQEMYDFVITNVDLYESNFKIGGERIKRSQTFVLSQIESTINTNSRKKERKKMDFVGDYVQHVKDGLNHIETWLQETNCF